jgi:hypothetical protein
MSYLEEDTTFFSGNLEVTNIKLLHIWRVHIAINFLAAPKQITLSGITYNCVADAVQYSS